MGPFFCILTILLAYFLICSSLIIKQRNAFLEVFGLSLFLFINHLVGDYKIGE